MSRKQNAKSQPPHKHLPTLLLSSHDHLSLDRFRRLQRFLPLLTIALCLLPLTPIGFLLPFRVNPWLLLLSRRNRLSAAEVCLRCFCPEHWKRHLRYGGRCFQSAFAIWWSPCFFLLYWRVPTRLSPCLQSRKRRKITAIFGRTFGMFEKKMHFLCNSLIIRRGNTDFLYLRPQPVSSHLSVSYFPFISSYQPPIFQRHTPHCFCKFSGWIKIF